MMPAEIKKKMSSPNPKLIHLVISVRLKTKQIQLDIILCSIVSVG